MKHDCASQLPQFRAEFEVVHSYESVTAIPRAESRRVTWLGLRWKECSFLKLVTNRELGIRWQSPLDPGRKTRQ